MFISETEALAVKAHAAPALRALGVKDLAAYEPHTRTWAELNADHKAVLAESRRACDRITDKMPEEDAAKIERAVDALIDVADGINGEKDKRTEIGNRDPRAHGGSLKRPTGATGAAPGSDLSAGDPEAEEAVGLRADQRMRTWADQRGREDRPGLSVGRYLRAMVAGAKTDAEYRALAEGTDSSGGYTVPERLSAELIDLMRARTVAIRAGAITVPLDSDKHVIATVATDPVPAWRVENAAVAESDPTFGSVVFEPKSLAVMVKISRELFEDSINLALRLPEVLAAAMAVELDRVALFGSGTPPEPRGIVNTVGVDEVSHGAALTSFAPLVTARTHIQSANHTPTGMVLHPRDEGTFAGLTASDNQPLNPPRVIAELPQFVTTAVPTDGGTGTNESSIVMGDFSRLLIGMRSQIRVELFREPFAANMQYALIAHLRADVAVDHPTAFSKITGITP